MQIFIELSKMDRNKSIDIRKKKLLDFTKKKILEQNP